MSEYYNPKRTRNLFDSESSKPFKISRSKIDLFWECAQCFYLDRKLGVARPPGFPFSLNSAVDNLLKKEFDIHRAGKTAHPLMKKYGVDAVPYIHEKIDEWRDPFKGVQFWHEPTNFIITGAIDDIWVNFNNELSVVDYKATAKSGEVNLDAGWQDGYKRQVEVYQWLFRKNGFLVSDTAYFVYANGITDKKAFDGKLEFDVKIIPYRGSDSWVEKTLKSARLCLDSEKVPEESVGCDYCSYRKAVDALRDY